MKSKKRKNQVDSNELADSIMRLLKNENRYDKLMFLIWLKKRFNLDNDIDKELAGKMKQKGFDNKTISRITGLTEREIAKL